MLIVIQIMVKDMYMIIIKKWRDDCVKKGRVCIEYEDQNNTYRWQGYRLCKKCLVYNICNKSYYNDNSVICGVVSHFDKTSEKSKTNELIEFFNCKRNRVFLLKTVNIKIILLIRIFI